MACGHFDCVAARDPHFVHLRAAFDERRAAFANAVECSHVAGCRERFDGFVFSAPVLDQRPRGDTAVAARQEPVFRG